MFVEFLSPDVSGLQVCPSSALGRVSVATDAPSVTVSLSCDGLEFYSAVLYAYGGTVTVYDTASVIESHFLSKGWFLHQVRIKAAAVDDPEVSDFRDVNCLYCAYDMPADFNASAAFLSCLQSQRVPPSAVVSLYGVFPVNSQVRFSVSGFLPDGSPAAASLDTLSGDGCVVADIPDIISKCRDLHGMMSVAVVSVYCLGSGKSLFVCDMPDALEFRFRNCFNCPESVFVSGLSVMKTEASRDVAVCDGDALQYNHSVLRSYEHTTAPLTRIEAASMSQLIESKSVAVVVDGSEYPVIIDDHTAEVSNDDSTLNSIKFTWRFTGSRPRIFGDMLSPLMQPFGIFTQQFNDPYQ